MSDINNIKEAVNLALAFNSGKSFQVEMGYEEIPAVMVPDGFKLETFPEHRQYLPRIEQIIELDTPEAWLAYWHRFASPSSTAFFDHKAARLVGYVDFHQSPNDYENGAVLTETRAKWARHQVIYQCPITPEWKKWRDNTGEVMDQAGFARFIEDGIPDITEPTGADMLEIVASLQVHNKVNFRQALRLDNGETQFTYEENIEGKAGSKGQLKIPQTIHLGLRLFDGGPGYALEARFRYKIKEGQLSMWYDLIRPERVHDVAVGEVYDQIAAELKVGQLLRGRLA